MVDKTAKQMALFNKRWNIEIDDKLSFSRCKNRILYVIEEVAGWYIYRHDSIQRRFLFLTGELDPTNKDPVFRITDTFRDTHLYSMLKSISNEKRMVWILKNLFIALEEGLAVPRISKSDKSELTIIINKLVNDINTALDFSPEIQIRIRQTKYGVQIYRTGARFFDDVLVNDVLDWLENYPDAKKLFSKALNFYLEKDKRKDRELIDDLRLSLEFMIRSILGNKLRLEEQATPLKEWMSEKNVQENIRQMFTDFLRHKFVVLQNDSAKHGDRLWSDAEVEYLIYQTALFMRLLLRVNEIRLPPLDDKTS